MIYLVEDDPSIRDLILYALEHEGHTCRGFENFAEFKKAMGDMKPALILLDVMLPGEDGFTILQWVRQNREFEDIPIIMLTAKADEINKITGLDLGADDYVTKPFSVLELLARIRAVLRRYGKGDDETLSYEGITVDLKSRRGFIDGEEVEFSYKEFELLVYFLQHPTQVLSREQMMDRVWGYEYLGESRTVDVHIAFLRQKLGDRGKLIKTVRNVGYKLEGDREA